jgi:sugar phosphate isomerase/epimerase
MHGTPNTGNAPAATRHLEFKSCTRRRFIGGAAGACLGAGLSRFAGTAEAEHAPASRKVTVGAHPWVYAATLQNHDITPRLPDIFADMRYAGMDGIELMHTALRPDDAVARIQVLIEKYSLPVIGSSFGGEMWDRTKHAEVLADAEKVVERLAKLGGKTLGTSVGASGKKKTPEQLDAQAHVLRKIIALCGANGVTLNLHNHTYEVVDDMYDLRGTLERIPDVKLGPDLNWLLRGGVDPVKFLRQYGKQIVFLHLRDQKADGRWSEAMGEGDMDYAGIGKVLQDIHFSGCAVIELAHEANFRTTRPLRESLKLSRECVRKTLGF